MSKHLICSNPNIYFTDTGLEHTRKFLAEVVRASGEASIVIFLRWEDDARQLDQQFTHDLEDLKKSLSNEDYVVELDRRAMIYSVPSEPSISLAASLMSEIEDRSEIHMVGDISIIVDKSSFRKLGKEKYEIDWQENNGKMVFID